MSTPVTSNGTPWHQLPGATGGIRTRLSPRPVPQIAYLEKIFLGPFAQIAARLTGGDPEDWDTIDEIIDNIVAGLGVPDLEGLLDALLGNYTGDNQALLDIQSWAGDLGGFAAAILSAPAGLINLGQLTTRPVNLLPGGSFDTPDTVAEGEGWSHSTEGRDKPGSALFTATGNAGMLLSPAPAEVEGGKTYTAVVFAKWASLSGSGDVLAPRVRWYDAAEALISETAMPTLSNPAPAGGWQKLEGIDLTAPANARWAHLVLDVASGVTGTVWWDDAGLFADQQTLPQAIIDGLAAALEALGEDVEEALAKLKALIQAITGQARATLTEALADAQTFAQQLKTILSGGSVASPLPNLVGSTISTIRTSVEQIAAIANGESVTPVNAIVQKFKDGWSGLSALTEGVEAWIQDLIDAILRALRKVPVVGGTLADIIAEVGNLDDRATNAKNTADGVQTGIVEGWMGGSAVGADPDVYDTMGAIRALVGGDGYTRVNITSTQGWSKPAGTTEVIVVGIAAGQNGANGGGGPGGNGGNGGQGGGHKVQALNPGDFTSLHVTIGTNGAPTQFKKNGSSGELLMEAVAGATGGMATQFGYSSSSSQAAGGGGGGGGTQGDTGGGSGGNGAGGGANGGSGAGGDNNNAGAGGAGGGSAAAMGAPAAAHATNGSAGGSVPIAAIPCGGGGGGGGGGGRSYSSKATGGSGGPGGFPGGGGGGGGGGGWNFASGAAAGSGGAGAAGFAIIFYR